MGIDIYKYTSEQRFRGQLHDIVSAAGGEWLGIQDALLPDMTAQIVVRNPPTHHIFNIPFTPLDYDTTKLHAAICAKLTADTEAYASRTVSVKVETLAKIAKMILELSQEIDALDAGRKS